MPNDDLTRAFAALSGDAGHARLAPAAAVRKRGDRRTLTRSLAGVAAAAVLVAGVLVGPRLVLPTTRYRRCRRRRAAPR